MESIDCIFCNTSEAEARVVIEENGFSGRQCPNCGLVYISPRPTLAEISNIYEHENADMAIEGHLRADFIKRLHARHTLGILKRCAQGGSLLEIGPGVGYFLRVAGEAGFDVRGCELNPLQAEFINRRLRIPCEKALLEDAFPGEIFDVIYHCNVMSHLYDRIGVFHSTNRRLKPGGLVMFETGKGDVDERYFRAVPTHSYPEHLFYLSEGNMRTLLEMTGFELVALRRYAILPYLRLNAMLVGMMRGMRKLLRRGRPTPAASATNDAAASAGPTLDVMELRLGRPGGVLEPLKKLADLWLHCLVYGIGRWLPKRRKPQTLIVVGRKRAAAPAS